MSNRLILACALLLTGCTAPPVVPDWADHPANPAAAEAPPPPPSQTLATTATAPTTQHEAQPMPGMHHGSGAMQNDMPGMTPATQPSQGGKP